MAIPRATVSPVGSDVRKYKTLQMFIHAEGVAANKGQRFERVLLRLGVDYVDNYCTRYEYREVAQSGTTSRQRGGLMLTESNLQLSLLTNAKLARSAVPNTRVNRPYVLLAFALVMG